MGVSKKIEHHGRTYESIAEFAKTHDLHQGNTYRRYNESNWTLEECIDPSIRIRPNNRGIKVTIEGVNFKSLTAAAKFYGETRSNVTCRRARGWTDEQAVGVDPPPDIKAQSISREIIFLGGKFPSKRARDAFYGLNKSCIEKRQERGWSDRQAAGLDSKPSKKRNWIERETIDGKAYPKSAKGNFKLYVIKNSINSKEYVGITISPLKARWRGHCRDAFGLNENNKFKNALRKHGKEHFTIELIRNDAKNWPELEEQEKAEIKKRDCFKTGYNSTEGGGMNLSKPITVDGILFASYVSAAEHYEIDQYLFNSRLSADWSPEQAAGIVEPNKPYSYPVKIGDQAHRSLKSASKAQDVKYANVWNRRNNLGWSEEQALGLIAPPESYEKCKAKKIKLEDCEFESQAQMARYLDISPATLTKRKNNGEAYQSIFDHFKNNGGRRKKVQKKSVET